jgi:hypothetical protein
MDKQTQEHMKLILLLMSILPLTMAAGCIFPGHRGGGDYHDHGEYRGHDESRDRSEYRSYGEPEIEDRPSFGYTAPL